jgi:hypothetical protein
MRQGHIPLSAGQAQGLYICCFKLSIPCFRENNGQRISLSVNHTPGNQLSNYLRGGLALVAFHKHYLIWSSPQPLMRCSHESHITDEQTETQMGRGVVLGHTSTNYPSQDFTPGLAGSRADAWSLSITWPSKREDPTSLDRRGQVYRMA